MTGLAQLRIKDRITRGTVQYEKYDLTTDKAIHVVVYQHNKTILDIHFGKRGTRGQMVRFEGVDGIFLATGYAPIDYRLSFDSLQATVRVRSK